MCIPVAHSLSFREYKSKIYYHNIYEYVRLCKFNCYTEKFSMLEYFAGWNKKKLLFFQHSTKIRLSDMKRVKGFSYSSTAKNFNKIMCESPLHFMNNYYDWCMTKRKKCVVNNNSKSENKNLRKQWIYELWKKIYFRLT